MAKRATKHGKSLWGRERIARQQALLEILGRKLKLALAEQSRHRLT